MNGIRNTATSGDAGAFAKKLRELRSEQGLSIAALAHRVHYSRGHLNNVEHCVKAPSPELAAACDEALGADGELEALIPRQARAEHRPAIRPAQLPGWAGHFVGRVHQLEAIDTLLTRRPRSAVGVIHGPPGVGKTTLALQWAQLHRGDFPDGHLFADLRGHAPNRTAPADPDEVLEEFLVSLGLPSSEVPPPGEERSALFRSLTDGQRLLIALDNAGSSGQVQPLLPGAAECVVLVTSRTHLSGLAVRTGAVQVRLEPFKPDEALTLLREIVDPARVDGDPEVAQAIVEHCGHLPLAVALAGERIAAHPPLTLADLAAELTEERARLAALAAEDDDQTTVRTVFSWSYRSLEPATAKMFRRLGLHPGREISAGAAAALADTSTERAHALLRMLSAGHLVEEMRQGRFVLHDLLRLYASERVAVEESENERATAERRELIWYLHTAEAAGRKLAPYENHPMTSAAIFAEYQDAFDWCEAELPNFIAIIKLANRLGQHDLAWHIPRALFPYFHLRKPWGAWESTYRLGLDAAREEADPAGEAVMLQGIGLVRLGLRRFEEALIHFQRAYDVLDSTGDRSGSAWSLVGMGLAHAGLRHLGLARSYLERGRTTQRTANDRHGEAVTLIHLADTCREQRRAEDARDYASRALGIFREIGDVYGEGLALYQVGNAHAAAGDFTEAARYLNEALEVNRSARDDKGEADTLHALSHALLRAGDKDTARKHLYEALRIFDKRGDPAGDEVRARLAYLEEESETDSPDSA
ncbi:tetratricopeptide repeat protein [Amycolatopsis sp. K13G38]|uniref:Tetratricopeptide repeat protein n=1 Tax=Amycolatopsis acididurans TaxID=2724524 RepID=A0ABX1J145_9PSEU|nr:tetratricopeptide repeat protein [Amycolatopsis acididurans]NKQ51976.1 tetratricopeptide repeat protein [Amycolatopsis acididurans]